jgi:hypothetical protein
MTRTEHGHRDKRGDVPRMEDVLDEIAPLESTVEHLLASGRTPLPPEADWNAISAWSVRAHRLHWGLVTIGVA